MLSDDPEDYIYPRGMALIKIKNSASILSKIIMLVAYLLANHSSKIVKFFTEVHYKSKLAHNRTVLLNTFNFSSNLLRRDIILHARKFIAKDKESDILMYEDSSPYTMSPRYQNFLPSAFSSIHNAVTLVRYVNFNKTSRINHI
jgi:hypothetical protein